MSALALRRPLGSVRTIAHARRIDAAVIAAPALLAFALCLYQLGARSLWLDEAASVSIAGQHGGAFAAALARDGGNMLGYYGLLHLLVAALGDGAVVLRLPSALAAGVTVGLVAAIGLRLWGRRAATVAGVLSAVSLPLVYWGQDARGYAEMIALCAGSWLALLHLTEDRRAGARGGWWAAYVVLTAAAIYMGLEAALIVPAQLVVLSWRRQAARRVLWASLTAGLLCLPLAVLAIARGASQLFWVPPPSLFTAKQLAQALTSSGLQPAYYTPSGDALLYLTAALLILATAWLALGRRSGREGALIVLLWLVVPIGLELLLSLGGHSIFQARYALISLPAVSLLLAWACTCLPRRSWLGLGVVAALLALRAVALAPSYGASTEPWRSAASYVAEHSRTGDCIAFYPQDTRMPFEYYAGQGGRLPASVLPAEPWGEVRSYVERYGTLPAGAWRRLAAACERMWLISSHEGRVGGPPVVGANARRLRSLRAALGRAYQRPATRKFGRASPISVELFTAGR